MSDPKLAAVDRPTVLLVDDDEAFRERLGRALRDRGYEVRTADGYDAALALARADTPEYAVVDLRMPGRSGLEVVRDLAQLDPHTRIVILTGYGSIATAVDAVRLGAVQYLPKPADADDLVAAFQRADLPPLAPLTPPAPLAPLSSLASLPLPAAGPVSYAAPSLARAEWEHIQRVLRDCRGNISEAARRLGLPRRSLQRKLGKHPPMQ